MYIKGQVTRWFRKLSDHKQSLYVKEILFSRVAISGLQKILSKRNRYGQTMHFCLCQDFLISTWGVVSSWDLYYTPAVWGQLLKLVTWQKVIFNSALACEPTEFTFLFSGLGCRTERRFSFSKVTSDGIWQQKSMKAGYCWDWLALHHMEPCLVCQVII